MPNVMPKMERDGKLKVSITISPTILAKVDAQAEAEELSRSTVIQMILREYFAK